MSDDEEPTPTDAPEEPSEPSQPEPKEEPKEEQKEEPKEEPVRRDRKTMTPEERKQKRSDSNAKYYENVRARLTEAPKAAPKAPKAPKAAPKAPKARRPPAPPPAPPPSPRTQLREMYLSVRAEQQNRKQERYKDFFL
jgi:hypothetical protein